MSSHLHGGPVQKLFQDGQIMFRVIDGVFRMFWSGPAQLRQRSLDGACLQFTEPGQVAFGGAKYFQPVKGGNARTPLDPIHPRI